jgi:signal recognition particle subunit SRP54
MSGLQNILRQLQQGAAGGLSNLMGGFGGQS